MNERMIKKVLWSSLLVLSLIVAVLGNSTTVFADNSPSYVVKVACGFVYTVVLKSDGTVWAWGDNSFGQLGDGTTTDRHTPVQASGLSDVAAIAAGTYHTVALKKDGTVWAWGYNKYGQLGDGTEADRSVPVQIPYLRDVTVIAAGLLHTVVLKDDGTVWAWGENEFGQLGDGTNQVYNI